MRLGPQAWPSVQWIRTGNLPMQCLDSTYHLNLGPTMLETNGDLVYFLRMLLILNDNVLQNIHLAIIFADMMTL